MICEIEPPLPTLSRISKHLNSRLQRPYQIKTTSFHSFVGWNLANGLSTQLSAFHRLVSLYNPSTGHSHVWLKHSFRRPNYLCTLGKEQDRKECHQQLIRGCNQWGSKPKIFIKTTVSHCFSLNSIHYWVEVSHLTLLWKVRNTQSLLALDLQIY